MKKMINKFECVGFSTEYSEVFRKWENSNIVERFPYNKLSDKCHYLQHTTILGLGKKLRKYDI